MLKFCLITLAVLTMAVAAGSRSDDISSRIPSVHAGLAIDSTGTVFFEDSTGRRFYQREHSTRLTLEQMRGGLRGTDNGLAFDFNRPDFNGLVYYGLRPHLEEASHVYPAYFKRSAKIENGRAEIDIKNNLVGKYDFTGWTESGTIDLGYRIVDGNGHIIYDGKIKLTGNGPFRVDTSIIEGPFVNLLTHESAVISFTTNYPVRAQVIVDDRAYYDSSPGTHHELKISDRRPDTEYTYRVYYGHYSDEYSFRTAPLPGSRRPFTFAYASDGRASNGGGERDIGGVNGYVLKKIAALVEFHKAGFFQFTGDLINGYTDNPGAIELEYANWKRAVEPFAHYRPFIAGFGNHEALLRIFYAGRDYVEIDRFPYDEYSSEAIFATNFVNPENGPDSEDGAEYDPHPDRIDFPSYKETAFYYTYDNVAIISLNSNYWYSPTIDEYPSIGGNLHGYIMDNQLAWLAETLERLEKDDDIDHIFVTVHTPLFPSGGHVGDAMWYGGDNSFRPTIAGKPVTEGIIERRDRVLDLLMNGSSKVVATLTGDEHNYYRLRVSEDMPLYPENYSGPRLTRIRPIWHLNNGAAGAPYYGREATPWSEHLEVFSVQNALIFFHVHGRDIRVEVYNPDTLELIDEFEM